MQTEGKLKKNTRIKSGSNEDWGPGGEGTPLFGLFGYVPLERVWFSGLAVLNRVYNLSCLSPKQV